MSNLRNTGERSHWMVFSDDWGRHPSSCQYLIRELLNEVDVTWVNTIGMRTPRLDAATCRRVFGKLKSMVYQGGGQTQTLQPNHQETLAPKVINPVMWPWFSRSHDRWLNRTLLTRALSKEANSWQGKRIAITTIPIVADLVGRLPVDRWIYYCVDDFSVWPGLDQPTMQKMEADLVSKVDFIFTVSEVLQANLQKIGFPSKLLTHGVDLQRWNSTDAIPFAWPSRIIGPVALFWGVVDRRLDVSFIQCLSARQSAGNIVFVGPHQDPPSEIFKLPNVHFLPAVSPELLPAMARQAACLIMPYSDSEVTRAMQPLKLKEYLATDRPVVARRLPSTESWADACHLVSTCEEFADKVVATFDSGLSTNHQIARVRLCDENWAFKASVFRNHIENSSHEIGK